MYSIARRAQIGLPCWTSESILRAQQQAATRSLFLNLRRQGCIRSFIVTEQSRRICQRLFGQRSALMSSSPNSTASTPKAALPPIPPPPEDRFGRFKFVLKQYGPVALGTYFSLYVGTLGFFYALFESGVKPSDHGMGDSGTILKKVIDELEKYEWASPLVESLQKNPNASNFALAWVVTKVTEPLRLLVTLSVVPKIARWLGRAPPKIKKQ